MDKGVSLILRIAGITTMPCAVLEMATNNIVVGAFGWCIAALLFAVADMRYN